jgi:hypothetical protein
MYSASRFVPLKQRKKGMKEGANKKEARKR